MQYGLMRGREYIIPPQSIKRSLPRYLRVAGSSSQGYRQRLHSFGFSLRNPADCRLHSAVCTAPPNPRASSESNPIARVVFDKIGKEHHSSNTTISIEDLSMFCISAFVEIERCDMYAYVPQSCFNQYVQLGKVCLRAFSLLLFCG